MKVRQHDSCHNTSLGASIVRYGSSSILDVEYCPDAGNFKPRVVDPQSDVILEAGIGSYGVHPVLPAA